MGVYTHTPYISERNREYTKRDTDTLILPLKVIDSSAGHGASHLHGPGKDTGNGRKGEELAG